MFGVGVTWNLTTILRNAPQVKAQRYISSGLQNEYELVDQQHAQLALAETKIKMQWTIITKLLYRLRQR
ncbi:hypothetical protein CS542_05335 [Pedobacter sp. IW39]|nr:hypothetical protein CS542_05335 [Pedobacter sp. IW39]